MNNHAFAKGTVYPRPRMMNRAIASSIAFLYKVYVKLGDWVKSYFIWSLNLSRARFGEGCYLSENCYINNGGCADNIVLGDNVICKGILRSDYGGRIIVGNDVYIGDGSIFSSFEKIEVGNNVFIAHGVQIFDNISHPTDAERRHDHFKSIMKLSENKIKKDEIAHQSVRIGSNVWIGFSSIILKGVSVGNGAIIGAGSIVTKDIPPYTVVAGKPAQVVKQLQNLEEDVTAECDH